MKPEPLKGKRYCQYYEYHVCERDTVDDCVFVVKCNDIRAAVDATRKDLHDALLYSRMSAAEIETILQRNFEDVMG